MHRILLLLWVAVVLGLSIDASAQDDPKIRSATALPPYFTQFGDNFLRKSSLVVQGKVKSVQTILGGELVEIEVSRRFKGKEPTPLTMLTNPNDFFVGNEQVLFLTPFHGGPRYTCLNRFSIDADFPAKLQCLNRHLTIEKIRREDERQRQVRRMLLENAASSDHWTCMNVVNEVRYILKTYPLLLSADDKDELRLVARTSKDGAFQKEILQVLGVRAEAH